MTPGEFGNIVTAKEARLAAPTDARYHKNQGICYNIKMIKPKKQIAVAMSGGVDSSVAAALLARRGYEVFGITMKFDLKAGDSPRAACCSIPAITGARRVAKALGIKHYVVNLSQVLQKQVIADFCREYARGRTPNPCVRCNQYVKFGALLAKARELGGQFLATGHYARITGGNSALLKKAKDRSKDQSYFLYRLSLEQLRRALFPLGNYSKEQVRSLARKFNLPAAERPESQEICFVPRADYHDFLAGRIPAGAARPGPIRDMQGRTIGEHKGIPFYTIGQRGGLGVAAGYPIYVVRIDRRANAIYAGSREQAYFSGCLVRTMHFIHRPIKKRVVLKVKIRYNHKEARAVIEPCSGAAVRIKFFKPQFAITPGQSAVFYDKDTVVGGGIIHEVLK